MELTGSLKGEVVRAVGHAGTELGIRVWSPQSGHIHSDLVLLHGVVSHSGWMSPIAARIAAAGHRVICPDRRGVGLSGGLPGDAASVDELCQDVEAIIQYAGRQERPFHIGGFCWGATYVINFMERAQTPFESFVMIAPSVFPAPDIGGSEMHVGDSSEATEIPNVPIDRFTRDVTAARFIRNDPLRTQRVSPRFNGMLVAMNRLLAPRWAKLSVPTLMIQASGDRLSDVAKHSRAFQRLKGAPLQETLVEGEHGLQFDAPHTASEIITTWLSRPEFAQKVT